MFRDEWGRVLASLIGYFGDWDLAEDAAAEAFAIAAQRWPSDGVPDHPAAWLITTARRRAIDRLRRDRVLAAKLRLIAAAEPPAGEATSENTAEDTVDTTPIPDERLELVFLCCHPALAVEAQVALTLRAVGGLSTEEIARAFLVSPETMKRRLTRAKSKIKVAGIPFGVPSGPRLPERLGAILAVVYLIFNEGYGDPDRPGLAAEAIRLGRVLAVLLPAQPEVLGLLALMLLHDSRRETRFAGDKHGQDLVLLSDQDRSRWDWRQIAEGRALLDRALSQATGTHAAGRTGPYVIQAAIASLQAEEQLDWPQISVLYGKLAELTGSPVVRLNRAVAVAEADGPAAALAIVDQLDLPDYQYWHSTRAELLRRLGRGDEARAAYRCALDLARTAPERRFLERRIAES
ncbi:MAG TPA: sigma-70 family RNA polymerase sigma factor [Streptosporangiaceae bacterium]|nr:sigma-70 family RNA polymerase sigma factor [Streptosporangiaceae bacterium]